MSSAELPLVVRLTRGLEEATALDAAVRAVESPVRTAFSTGPRGALLRGDWLGHALHPLLTDVVLGTWTSATILDLIGGRDSSKAAQRLIATGLLAVGPTAWSGWAEWTEVDARSKRVGLVHAVANGVAISAYASSWLARRRGERGKGVRRALIGGTVSGVAGYLGGHLAQARKVATHHPAFDEGSPVAGAGALS